jgi:hypothetical protein
MKLTAKIASLMSLFVVMVSVDPPTQRQAIVNYEKTIATGNPLVFGSNHFVPASNVQAAALVRIGITWERTGYDMSRIVPSSSNSVYESALKAGCQPGSICDPNSWNWNWEAISDMPVAHSYDLKVLGIMGDTVAWNSSTGSRYGMPTDWAVYNDINRKLLQHFIPDFVEIWNEPNGDGFGALTISQYLRIYEDLAQVVRSVGPNIQIGGPATDSPISSWVEALLTDPNIPANDINFVSYHSYPKTQNALNTSIISTANTYRPGIPIYITEWNYDGVVRTGEDNDGADSLAFIGSNLIYLLSEGFAGGQYYTAQQNQYGLGGLWDSNGLNLLPKARSIFILAKQLGLAAGPSSIKSTLGVGVSPILGAINSAGTRVAAIVNYSAVSVTVNVKLSNTGLSNVVRWQTYLADMNSNTAQYPTENINVRAASNGSVSHIISMTPYSVAGIVLGKH